MNLVSGSTGTAAPQAWSFGGDRPLRGLFLPAAADRAPRPAVLLCRSFGLEATRSTAMFRVLARRLAREGSAVLSFDYHGCGDSPGAESAQDLAGWARDLAEAHARLQAATGAPVWWFAMGLGATLAMRAMPRVARAPQGIVLWEPPAPAPRLREQLFEAHRAEVSRECHEPWPALVRRGMADEPAWPGTVLGFDVGPSLAADLQALPPLDAAPALRRGTRVVAGLSALAPDALLPLPGVETVAVETRIDWRSSQAQGSATVPREVPLLLARLLDGVPAGDAVTAPLSAPTSGPVPALPRGEALAAALAPASTPAAAALTAATALAAGLLPVVSDLASA